MAVYWRNVFENTRTKPLPFLRMVKKAGKVEYDFACVVFAEYQDALDFCAGRFFDSAGKPVKAVRA